MNSNPKTKNLVNWGTVWGLIFSAIALDLYLNYNEQKKDKEVYRSQYEAKAWEADSLRAVKSELERQLFEMKSTRNGEPTSSAPVPVTTGENAPALASNEATN